MDVYDATEQAYVNGYSAGYSAGRRSMGDGVELVRCKDCKHYREGFCFCENWWKDDGFTEVGADDFCSHGKLREA